MKNSQMDSEDNKISCNECSKLLPKGIALSVESWYMVSYFCDTNCFKEWSNKQEKIRNVNVNDLEWSKAVSYPAGTEEKILNEGSKIAPRSIMLKLPPGWKMNNHSHRFTELHYVLEGQVESNKQKYPTGTFRVIPKGIDHGPFTSKLGAIILIIWCALAEDKG